MKNFKERFLKCSINFGYTLLKVTVYVTFVISIQGCIGGSSPIFKAIRKDDSKKLQELITQGEDINKLSKSSLTSPLYYAVIKKHNDIIKILLDNGANVNVGVLNIYDPMSFS